MMASPSTTLPSASTARQRSASPSWASPRSAPWATTACLQRLHVRRPAAVVDVQSVGFGVDRDHVGAGGPVGPRGGGRRGAVRAVDDDGQPVEAGGDGLARVTQIALERVVGVDDPADARTDRALAGPGRDELLDAVLGGVVELVPARAEDLDAVVGHRVVRRRDHHAELGVVGVGQIGHRGGRQHADAQRVDAFTGDARDDGGLEHLAAGPRVAAHHGDAATGLRRVCRADARPPSPSPSASSAVRSRLATPRTPSVPNSRPIGQTSHRWRLRDATAHVSSRAAAQSVPDRDPQIGLIGKHPIYLPRTDR